MPEVWIPYGEVEALVTIQAENIGAVVEPAPGEGRSGRGRAKELLRPRHALRLRFRAHHLRAPTDLRHARQGRKA